MPAYVQQREGCREWRNASRVCLVLDQPDLDAKLVDLVRSHRQQAIFFLQRVVHQRFGYVEAGVHNISGELSSRSGRGKRGSNGRGDRTQSALGQAFRQADSAAFLRALVRLSENPTGTFCQRSEGAKAQVTLRAPKPTWT